MFNKILFKRIILIILSFSIMFFSGVLFGVYVIKSDMNFRHGQNMMADYFYHEILNNFGSWSRFDEIKYEVFGGIDLKGPARIDFIIINDTKSIIVYEYK